MKKFVINLFSNRFGIILAALNVCYFASAGRDLMYYPFGKIFACINLPALISAMLSLKFFKILTPEISFQTPTLGIILLNILLAFFITLQWLFIAWIAKTLSGKWQRPKL
jgi:hypothetical protein